MHAGEKTTRERSPKPRNWGKGGGGVTGEGRKECNGKTGNRGRLRSPIKTLTGKLENSREPGGRKRG